MGGVERQLLGVLPRLAQFGYEVSVCALKGPGPLTGDFQSLGFQTYWLSGKGKWDLRVVFRLYLLLRHERPVILHTYTTLANWAGAVAGRAAGVPLLIMSDRDIRNWLRPWQVMVERYAFRSGSCMTMPSEAIKRFNIERLGHPPQKLVVVPNGVNLEEPGLGENYGVDLGLEKKKPSIHRIGYVGRFVEPLKGLSVLLRALLFLKEYGVEFEAVLVGEGRDRKKTEELSRRLGLNGRVAFLGERKDVPRLMQDLDLLVIPSLSEGSPNVALEAMALGVPVLATNVGGTPEIIEHEITGWLVPPGDPVALAQTMADVLREPSKSLRVASRAKAWVVEHRSLGLAASAVVKLYDALLEEIQARKAPDSLRAQERERY